MEDFVENPPFPAFIQFETGTACNAKCLMCPHQYMKRRGTAKWSIINKVIREAIPTANSCCPFLYQEPMLEPRLHSILSNIKQRNSRCCTSVYSNMSYLPDGWERLIDHEVLDELHISFYGPTEQLYRKWQPPLKREVTVRNIQRFGLYRVRTKHFKPNIILHVLSVPEIMDAAEGYSDVIPYVDRIANVQYDTFHGDIPDLAGDQTPFLGPAKPRVPCQRLWTGLNVHYDGSVVPCCLDYKDENVMGNVEGESLQEIWSGMRFQKFRRLHIEGKWNDIPMCRRCRVHEYQFGEEWTNYWMNQNQALKVLA